MNKEKYIAFFKEQKELPIFLEPWFLDLCAEGGEWNAVVVEIDQRVVGVWPYFMKNKFGFSYLSMPHMCKYLGPYITLSSGSKNTVTKALYAQLPKHAFVQQNINYTYSEIVASIWPSLSVQKPSYQIDLSIAEDELWRALKSDYRNNKIKKAKTQVEISTELNVEEFLALNKASFKYQKTNFPVPDHIFKNIIQGTLNQKRGVLIGAKDKVGKWHAGLCLMWDHQHVYYHSAGTDPDLRSSGAGMYLIWEALCWAKNQHKQKTFDFLGSEIPGISNVWKNFGAVRISYTQIKKYNSFFFKCLRSIKSK